MIRRCLVAAVLAGLSLAAVSSTTSHVRAQNSTLTGITVRTLAQGSVKSRPAADVLVAILEFHQVPGSAWLPEYIPAIVYTLHGTTTVSSPEAAPRSVGAGDAAFLPAQSTPANDNVQGRAGAGAIAVGLIVVALLLCASTWLRGDLRRGTVGTLLVLLVAGGVWVLTGATANDWYQFAVRDVSDRSVAMPRPDGRVVLGSPDLGSQPPAPYMETLRAIIVPPSARYDVRSVPGPQVILVLQGTAHVQVGDETQQLGGGGAVFVQAGNALAIVNPGSDTVQVLDFAVTPLSAVPPSNLGGS
jgi:quercetin dioxygenase-like cupin family protein